MGAKNGKGPARSAQSRSFIPVLRYLGSITLTALGLIGAALCWQQLERFLIRDPRFMIAPPANYGEDSPDLRIQGIRYASRAQVMRVFRSDIGRSLYLFPLTERRNALRRIPWVKDASIVRTWPSLVNVSITERTPVAFVQLPADGMTRWSLIDSEGILLDPPVKAPFNLPVMTGVRPEEAASLRGLRVRRMRRMMEELGPQRGKVSDVDVADLDDLKVTLKMDGRPVVLMIGDRNFGSRFQHFLDRYEEIRNRVSDVTVLDLRLDDRITVLGGKHG